MKYGKMLAIEYHRRFTDISRYCPEITANPREMLRHFNKETCKNLRSMVTITPYTTYQEFFEILLRVEALENAPDDEDEDDNSNAQHNRNRGSHPWVLEGLRTLKEAETALDCPVEVQTLVHLVEAVDPLAVLVFRVKETPLVLVLSSVIGETPVTLASAREETDDASLTDRWGT